MNPTQLLKAIAFAANKHRDQRRKDAEASPYINHPIAVATVLAAEGGVSDEATLIAAALHDTVEDTQTTFGELEEHFGPEVDALVCEVTYAPPTDWPLQRRRDYLDWAMAVVAGCRGVIAKLDQAFDQATYRAKSKLGTG